MAASEALQQKADLRLNHTNHADFQSLSEVASSETKKEISTNPFSKRAQDLAEA